MMPVLVPVASYDQKSHVAPHVDHLDLRNAMVPLVLSMSHDANTNAVIPMSVALCDASANVHGTT